METLQICWCLNHVVYFCRVLYSGFTAKNTEPWNKTSAEVRDESPAVFFRLFGLWELQGVFVFPQWCVTCSQEKRCVELQRKRSALPAALQVVVQVRCWSTAGTHNEHPWNTEVQPQISWREYPRITQLTFIEMTGLLFVTLDPGVLVLPTVAFLCPLNVELLITELVSCCCLWGGHNTIQPTWRCTV